MNPSASDWILKFLNLFDKNELVDSYPSEQAFYDDLKKAGFIYGVSVAALPKKSLGNLKLTKDELTKVNLFHALLYQFFQVHKNASYSEAINDIITFYKQLNKVKQSFFHKFSRSQSQENILENIIAARLHETNASFKKNSISFLTYALLYLDVLAYKEWQKNPEEVKEQYQKLEGDLLSSCFYTLKSKKNKTKYNKMLIDLFETSAGYILDESIGGSATFLENLNYLTQADLLEKKYILDLCCLTVWEDLKMDEKEYQFLQQLAQTLNFSEMELEESVFSLQHFSEKYSKKILLFEYSHPLKQFYNQSAATVKLLIIRNKDRLARELEESGELVVLLGQSTVRDLSPEEKGKVKDQLLDICKTVPSLTIFLLPGGTVLLPLLVKFIPKLLPSSFQENRITPPSSNKRGE